MTPDHMRAAGAALYGANWVAALAADLGINPRTIFRWRAGAHQIPARHADRITSLLEQRAEQIRALLSEA